MSPPTTFNVSDPDGGQPCALYEVERHTRALPGRSGECELTVAWEGKRCMGMAGGIWFTGIVNSRFEQSTKTELLLLSYDVDPATGARRGIGPAGEGTNRFIGCMRWFVTQNLALSDYFDRLPVIQSLIGLVNQEGWSDPVTSRAWAAGAWLYLGPQAGEPRGGAVTLTHVFDYDPAGPRYAWHFTRDVVASISGRIRTLRQAVGQPQSSTIYPTVDVEGGQTFDNLWDQLS